MLQIRLPWLSMAARGDPAVPLVNIMAAMSSASTSTIGDRVRPEQGLEGDLVVADVALGPDHTGQRGQGGTVDVVPRCSCGRPDDSRDRADDGELTLELGRRTGRVQRHRDGAEAGHGEIGHDEVAIVAAQDRDAVAVADTLRDQTAAEPFRSDRAADRRWFHGCGR